MTKQEPGTFWREMLGQWEGIATQLGAELMKSGEFAGSKQGSEATPGSRAQGLAKEALGKALIAAKIPSQDEVASLGQRMTAVEERLAAIEGLLIKLVGQEAPVPAEPKAASSKKSSKRGK